MQREDPEQSHSPGNKLVEGNEMRTSRDIAQLASGSGSSAGDKLMETDLEPEAALLQRETLRRLVSISYNVFLFCETHPNVHSKAFIEKCQK